MVRFRKLIKLREKKTRELELLKKINIAEIIQKKKIAKRIPGHYSILAIFFKKSIS